MSGKGTSLGLFFASACVVFLIDVVTKLAVARRLDPGTSVQVLGDFVRFTHIRNIGASFGLLPGSTFILIVISSVAVVIVFFMALYSRGRPWAMVTLGMIMGGAVGNLSDRLRLGGVIDFVDVGMKSYRWPVFNAADVAVTLGVFLLLLRYIGRGEKRAGAPEADGRLAAGGGEVRIREHGESD